MCVRARACVQRTKIKIFSHLPSFQVLCFSYIIVLTMMLLILTSTADDVDDDDGTACIVECLLKPKKKAV